MVLRVACTECGITCNGNVHASHIAFNFNVSTKTQRNLNLKNPKPETESYGILQRAASLVIGTYSCLTHLFYDRNPAGKRENCNRKPNRNYVPNILPQAPESVRGVLGEAKSFFRQEHVAAGAVLADHGSPSSSSSSPEKVYFIGSGSVELQVSGVGGWLLRNRHKLLRL